jgi:hypothetical protein
MKWIAAAALIAVLTPHTLAAQASALPSPGESVRVKGTATSGRFTMRSLTGTTLMLRDENGADVSVEVGALESLAVARPRSRGAAALRGSAIGLLAGAATGAVIGFLDGDDPRNAFIQFSAGEKAALGGILLGAGGAAAGMLIGLAAPGQHWEDVPLTQLRAGAAADGGVILRTGVRF